MVWKQDLAKLKQQFKEEEPVAKAPVPKAVPKPPVATNLSMEEQDTMFLNAMGRRSVPQPGPKSKVPQAEAETAAVSVELPAPPLPAEDFQAAMGGLKGIKPLTPKIPVAEVKAEPVVEAAPVVPEAPSEPLPELPVSEVIPPVATPVTKPIPERIQLAAGMAIEVDVTLDLRGHTTVDAMERFRERLQDGVFLGWRTFHVIFGISEELSQAFQSFLASDEAHVIARFAQAPIPMGGNQAWILYYAAPGH